MASMGKSNRISNDAAKDDYERLMGGSAADRTQALGRDSNAYRKSVHMVEVNKDTQNKHNKFIHHIGREVLKSRYDEDKQIELEKQALQRKQQKVATILRRKIRVADLEDGGVSISMDQEWDTSTWNEELIQAGCDALIFIFYQNSGKEGMERKMRAVQMLQKLMFRHVEAEIHLQRNIEIMISKVSTKLIRGGRSLGLLDIMFVLHCCKEKCLYELSHANFNGRSFEMLMQELRLAALLIQDSFRAAKQRTRIKTAQPIASHVGFIDDTTAHAEQIDRVERRSKDLRAQWLNMHCFHAPQVVKSIGGMRGPIHIGELYTLVILDIMMYLISPEAGQYAHGNREDIVRANGCILLTTLLASCAGPFSRATSVVLFYLSKTWESFLPLISTGCIGSAVKAMKFNRTVHEIGSKSFKAKKTDKHSALDSYLACLDMITYTAVHAAGMYRACLHYRYITPAHDEIEQVNYIDVMKYQLHTPGYTQLRLMDEIKLYLGHRDLVRELSTVLQGTEVQVVLTKALRCLFTLLCTEAHDSVVNEINALQGMLTLRVVDLVHYNDVELGDLALCVIMQMCTEMKTRKDMQRVRIDRTLSRRDEYRVVKTGVPNAENGVFQYKLPALQRNIAVTAMLCRQINWRYYDPQVTPALLQGILPLTDNNATLHPKDKKFSAVIGAGISDAHGSTGSVGGVNTVGDSDAVRHLVFLDLLRTMRSTEQISEDMAEKMSIADWVVVPNNEDCCRGMSAAAAVTHGAKALVDFVCHPDEVNYYESLPLEESAAVCVILEGLSADISTASMAFSSGPVNFIAKYVYLVKYLFLGKTMRTAQISILLNGVKSGVLALGRFALSIKEEPLKINEYIEITRRSELLTSCLFFMNTLSIQHPKLEENTRALQKIVGIGCLDFLSMYAELLVHADSVAKLQRQSQTISSAPPSLVALSDLYPAAEAVINLIEYLKVVHRKSSAIVDIFHRACNFLCQVTNTAEASMISIQEWKIFKSLEIYLPSPLSGILPIEESKASGHTEFHHHTSLGSMDSDIHKTQIARQAVVAEYKVSLMALPNSFFILCANLCQVDDGKAKCFTEGYVRRCMDRLNILNLEFIRFSSKYKRLQESQPDWRHLADRLSSALRFITVAANYHHPKRGSSNDQILHELYDFVALCKNIICWQLYQKTSRTQEVLICAYEALAAVAKDTYRISQVYEKFDLYETIRVELGNLDSFPERGARAAVGVLTFASHGITSKYIVDNIPGLREPLSKVARIYPKLAVEVNDCNWTLTKSTKLFKETVDPNYKPDRTVDTELTDFIRTGSQVSHSRATFLVHSNSFLQSKEDEPLRSRSDVDATLDALKSIQTTPSYSPSSASFSPAAAARLKLQQDRKLEREGQQTILNVIKPTSRPGTPGTPISGRGGTRSPAMAGAAATAGGESPRVPLLSHPSSFMPATSTYTAGRRVNSPATNAGAGRASLYGSALTNAMAQPTAHLPTAHAHYMATHSHAPEEHAGTYLHCGVSNCGSLLLPGAPHAHGHTAYLTDAQREHQLQHVATHSNHEDSANGTSTTALLSQLSARERGLQSRMEDMKSQRGFRDLRRHTAAPVPYPADSPLLTTAAAVEGAGGGGGGGESDPVALLRTLPAPAAPAQHVWEDPSSYKRSLQKPSDKDTTATATGIGSGDAIDLLEKQLSTAAADTSNIYSPAEKNTANINSGINKGSSNSDSHSSGSGNYQKRGGGLEELKRSNSVASTSSTSSSAGKASTGATNRLNLSMQQEKRKKKQQQQVDMQLLSPASSSPQKMRTISLGEMPQLKFTRPPAPASTGKLYK